MDRHDVPGITAEEVAEVHQEDLKIQDKYDCRALTYWFDAERETAFCLIEAPDRQAVKEMHDNAHGLIPHRIIRVDSKAVESFLGRIEDPEPSADRHGIDFPVFRDSAFRSIMVVKLQDAAVLLSEVGVIRDRNIFNDFNKIIQKLCREYGGQITQSIYEGFVTAFSSTSESVDCAIAIQERLREQGRQHPERKACAGIGITVGEPVTDNEEFFGEAIQLAERLCYIAAEGEIKVSSNIRDQYKREKLSTLPECSMLKALSLNEEEFLNRLMDITEGVWNQKEIKVGDICRQIGVSKSQLYRKITSLTDRSPTEFMKEFRLEKAIELIKSHPDNITEVAFESGFSNPSYFAKCFKEKFGLLPSEYRDRIG